MDRWNDSLFRAAAIASELVTHDQLAEAEALVRIGRVALAGPGARDDAEPASIDDDRLADVLVELGYLNRWQAQQLKAGRSRFVLGDYQIVDSIGQGGMGQVFKAVHTLLGRIEAIKVLPRSRATPENIASFRHEIRAQAMLDHPNLVRVSYAGFDGNVYFLVTEFVPGTDLRGLVKLRGPLPLDEAAAITSKIAEALAYIHSQELIHRDVKPGNVLVTPEGAVKLSDLGLAGFTVASGLDDPRAGKIVGTADYLAPEQILSPGQLTPATDIYSLGCTLYYAVTGKVPYPGGTTNDKARRHCHDTPLHPRHFNPNLSDDFVEVIADMMEKQVADRLRDAEAVIQRLRPWTMPQGRAPTAIVVPPLPLPHLPVEPPPAPEPTSATSPLASDVFDFTVDAQGMIDAGSQISQGTQPVAIALSDTVADGESWPADPQATSISTDDESQHATDQAAPPHRRSWPVRLMTAACQAVMALSATIWRVLRRGSLAIVTVARSVWRHLVRAGASAWRAWLEVPTPLKVTLIVSVTLAAVVIGLMAYSLL